MKRKVALNTLALASLLTLATSAQAQAPAPVPPPAVDPALPPPSPPVPAQPPVTVEPAVPAQPPVAVDPYPTTELPPAPAPAPEPLPVAEPEPPALPDRVSVGKSGGFFQPSSVLQAWVFFNKLEETDTNSTFRLRRAEVKVKGEIAPKLVGYTIMADFAKLLAATNVPVTGSSADPAGSVSVLQPGGTDGSILQDFWITFISDYADVSIGQFKIPVSLEGLSSSSRLLFPERALVARAYGDRRELGIKVEKKLGEYFYYYAGIFNGSGPNRLDNDREKDVGLRLEVYPVAGLTLGVVGYTTALGGRETAVRDRLEADVKFEAAGAIVQAEYIRATDGAEGARLKGHGAYGALAYTFIERIQPALRIGFLDINTDNDAAGKRMHYEAGLNYLLRSHEAKLSLSAGRFVSDAPTLDSTEVTLQAQVAF